MTAFQDKQWEQILHDDTGRAYRLWIEEYEHALDMWLSDRRTLTCGQVRCILHRPDEIELCEIIIEVDAWVRRHWLLDLLDSLRHRSHSTINYRERGLGKNLMHTLIDYGRQNEFKQISGFIQPHEGSTFEFLVEWYKRQGFNVDGGIITMDIGAQVPSNRVRAVEAQYRATGASN